MNGVCAANRLRPGFGHAEVPHFAGVNEVGHRTDRVFDRCVGIDAMLIVEIDVIDAEALQRRVAGALDVIGPSIDSDPRSVSVALVRELRRQYDLIATIANRASDELLVREWTVRVGRVEE